MEVPAALASCLGIAQGMNVAVKVLSEVPQAIGICVEPVSTDDWEVVEQNAGYMEEQILNQVTPLTTINHQMSECLTHPQESLRNT